MSVACAVAVALASTASFPRRDMSTASFPHHPIRDVFSLSGEWQFEFVNGTAATHKKSVQLFLSASLSLSVSLSYALMLSSAGTDWAANSTELPATLAFAHSQAVPSAWDARFGTGLEYSRGAGFYKTTVSIPPGRPAALHFQACSIYCRVFVDGKEIANSTAGGFTPFWADVPPGTVAERTVVVMASNVFDPVLTPTQAAYYDFYQYGACSDCWLAAASRTKTNCDRFGADTVD
jgi:hypothetical protein